MRGYTAGETVTAAELAAAGLLQVGEASGISSHAVFMPADEQGIALPVTIGSRCRIGPLFAGTMSSPWSKKPTYSAPSGSNASAEILRSASVPKAAGNAFRQPLPARAISSPSARA